MRNPTRQPASTLCVGVTILVVCTLVGAAAAPARETGATLVVSRFVGKFTGPGGPASSISFAIASAQTGPTGMITGLQHTGGIVPATCVKDGRTRIAGRDGAIGIHFDSNKNLRVQPRVVIPADGRFSLRLEHPAENKYDESFSVSIRGTFVRKTVSGRVQGTSLSDFFGRCRANRTFTARLVRG
jgi:hypothetical protein